MRALWLALAQDSQPFLNLKVLSGELSSRLEQNREQIAQRLGRPDIVDRNNLVKIGLWQAALRDWEVTKPPGAPATSPFDGS